MTGISNPFARRESPDPHGDVERAEPPHHASDAPGRDYPPADTEDDGTHHSSGASSPSEPRRPGTGERQAPRREAGEELEHLDELIPGEVIYAHEDVEINVGREVTTLTVTNSADRPIQIGSHFHFAEVNAALDFDRDAAWGKRLNVLSGGAMRFEPGAVEEVQLIPIAGQRIVRGLRGLCRGGLDD